MADSYKIPIPPPPQLDELPKLKKSKTESNESDLDDFLEWNEGQLFLNEMPIVFVDKYGINYEWYEEEGWKVKQTSTLEEALLMSQQQSVYSYQASGPSVSSAEEEKKKRREANLEGQKRAKLLESKALEELTPEEQEYLEKRKKKKQKAQSQKLKKLAEKAILLKDLPQDVTLKEIKEFLRKAGMIRLDPETRRPMIDFLRDSETKLLNGEAIVHFLNLESVSLAIQLLDGENIRETFKIKVEKATKDLLQKTIEIKSLENSGSLSKKKRRYNQKRDLGWEDNEETRVVLKNMFSLDSPPPENFFKDLEKDLYEEVSKSGQVIKIKIFENHPEGIVVIKFASSFVAERCVDTMNGRLFDGRKLIAELYDGWSDFNIEENEKDKQERLKKWKDYLEKEE